MVSVRTVTRWLDRAGLNRRRDLRPHRTDQPDQQTHPGPLPGPHDPPGHQEGRTHPTRRKLAGPRARSPKAKASKRGKGARIGYTYLHTPSTASPAWPTPRPSIDEKASTTIGFFCCAQTFTSLASHHQRIRPYTPQHNGKVERYNRILAEECLYARSYSSEQQRRDAVAVWSHHYNYHRPHTACHNQPPATRAPTHVTNVMTSYN